MKLGEYINMAVRGYPEIVRVIAMHGAGTIDVLTKDNQYFRISGLGV